MRMHEKYVCSLTRKPEQLLMLPGSGAILVMSYILLVANRLLDNRETMCLLSQQRKYSLAASVYLIGFFVEISLIVFPCHVPCLS